ncbi:MAG: T9SS type A sorting domain-containing protein [Cyclobacteriaceae bacterium]|nr:T9SS type A sorting domain-containing protein [Cyclobacteriaceae bacterium]
MASNTVVAAPDGGYYPWIELLNQSDGSIELSQYTLTKDTVSNNEWALPAYTLPSGQSVVIWFSGNESRVLPFQAGFSVDLSEQYFGLVRLGQLSHLLSFPFPPNENESIGLNPSKKNEWIHFKSVDVTPGLPNKSPTFWKKITNHTSFNPRDSSPNASLVYDGKIWVLAGYRQTPAGWISLSDVWNSSDGIHWNLVNASPPYDPYSSYIVFANKMWAFDPTGCYSSTDGVTWTKEAATFPGGLSSRMTMLNNTLYAVSGSYVWSSTDAINWTTRRTDAPWGNRRAWPGFVAHNGRLFYMGGGINYFTGNDYYYNDVWSSADGVNWELVTASAEWAGRYWFAPISFDNKLWIISGWNYYDYGNPEYGNMNEIWVSEDGNHWRQLISDDIWPNRHAPLVWIKDNALYVSSGYGGGGARRMYNDIWVCEKKFDLTIPMASSISYGDDLVPPAFANSVTLNAEADAYFSRADDKIRAKKLGVVNTRIQFNGDQVYYPYFTQQQVAISKRNLVVMVWDTLREVGQPNPEFRLRYDGFAFDETIADLISEPYSEVVADRYSPVGKYPIRILGGASDHYDIIRIPGILDVTFDGVLTPYPNPTSGRINFVLPYNLEQGDQVILVAMDGREVYRGTPLSPTNYFSIYLDVPDGLYVYHINAGDRSFSGRIAVSHD